LPVIDVFRSITWPGYLAVPRFFSATRLVEPAVNLLQSNEKSSFDIARVDSSLLRITTKSPVITCSSDRLRQREEMLLLKM